MVGDCLAISAGSAKTYVMARPDPPFRVVYADPLRREKSGRAKRTVPWFANREAAEKFQQETNARLRVEGTAGLAFDAVLRAGALAARQRLDAAGHRNVQLLQLAAAFVEQNRHGNAEMQPVAPALTEFLQEKEDIEGCAVATVTGGCIASVTVCPPLVSNAGGGDMKFEAMVYQWAGDSFLQSVSGRPPRSPQRLSSALTRPPASACRLRGASSRGGWRSAAPAAGGRQANPDSRPGGQNGGWPRCPLT